MNSKPFSYKISDDSGTATLYKATSAGTAVVLCYSRSGDAGGGQIDWNLEKVVNVKGPIAEEWTGLLMQEGIKFDAKKLGKAYHRLGERRRFTCQWFSK